jgi:hypothetical protein
MSEIMHMQKDPAAWAGSFHFESMLGSQAIFEVTKVDVEAICEGFIVPVTFKPSTLR